MMGKHDGKDHPFIPKSTGRWSGCGTALLVLLLIVAGVAIAVAIMRHGGN